MINYSCDLCNKECNGKVFRIPIAATWIEEEPCDLMPVEMNLCKKCRSNIYKAVEKIASKDKIKKLNALALDEKMGRF